MAVQDVAGTLYYCPTYVLLISILLFETQTSPYYCLYIARKESATDARSSGPRKKEKPDNPRLALRVDSLIERASKDDLLPTKEDPAAGDGRGDEGMGARGGSRYDVVL